MTQYIIWTAIQVVFLCAAYAIGRRVGEQKGAEKTMVVMSMRFPEEWARISAGIDRDMKERGK